MQRPVTAVSPDVAVPAPAAGNTPTVPSVPLSTEGIWSVPAAAGSRSSMTISAITCPEACVPTVDTVTVPAEAPAATHLLPHLHVGGLSQLNLKAKETSSQSLFAVTTRLFCYFATYLTDLMTLILQQPFEPVIAP